MDRQTTELSNEYDWASLPKGKIVDVGGGSGHVSRSLAEVRSLSSLHVPQIRV